VVSHGGTHLLIDAGISLRRIKESLRVLGLKPDDLAGVLVTHEHSDHVKGIGMLVKYHKTPVFSSCGASLGLCHLTPDIGPYVNGFEVGAEFSMGDIFVQSFGTPHDACESVGFRLQAGGTALAYVTDLGYITEEVMDAMRGADMAFVESNHDREMLKAGPYPPYLKKRISSNWGHLSNSDCGSFAVELVKSGTRFLQLSHLSRENNTPWLASETVGRALADCGIDVDKDVELDVALPFSPSRVYMV